MVLLATNQVSNERLDHMIDVKEIRNMVEFDREIEAYESLEKAKKRCAQAIDAYGKEVDRIDKAQDLVKEGLKRYVQSQGAKSIKGAFGSVSTRSTSKIVYDMTPDAMVEWAKESGYADHLVSREEKVIEKPIKKAFDEMYEDGIHPDSARVKDSTSVTVKF